MSGNDAAKTAKIEVWWNMNDCPIPEGYDARRVRPSIERVFKERGYSGPVSITAFADQKQTPCHVLLGLSSTGVSVAHTKSDSTGTLMYRYMVEWRGLNPPPATIMIISDQVEGDFSWDLARLQQRTRYHLYLAYSSKPCHDSFLNRKANWRWEQLLEEGGPPLVAGGLSSSAMFYCKSCKYDCQSLDKFRKHLSSYKHGLEEAVNPPDTRLSCVTKTWARNYPATPEHATAEILVLWNMSDCPIPEGYDARRVRPSIERAFKELGYSGPVSITAFADQKQIPDHHLLALSSTEVDFAHTLPWVQYSRMTTEFEEWAEDTPAPASVMIISDELASRKSHSSLICKELQRSNYNCFLAYSFRPFEIPVLLTSAEWLWDSLLAVSETRGLTLQKFSENGKVVPFTGIFSCELCAYDYCESLDDFKKHLSSKEHIKEEHRMNSHSQYFPLRQRLYKISKYHEEEAINPPYTKLLCATKTRGKNYPATPEHATAEILVLWNMKDCPIPEGYDARRVRPSIERAFKELGYTGPVSITAFADQKQIPDHHLLALFSTGVDFAHTLPWVEYRRMISEFEEWAEDTPAPASVMIISDELASCKYRSKFLCDKIQKSNYKCFLAYSVRPFEMPVLVTSAEWLWDSLLAVSETRRLILQKCSGSKRATEFTGIFSCELCASGYCESLDDFKKHLSSKEHIKEEHRMLSHTQDFLIRLRLYKISKYHEEVGYPPKTKRMRKAPQQDFVP